MENREKNDIKLKFGLALRNAVADSKLSLRELSASSEMEFSNVQRIAAGKVNLAITSLIALSEGLNISPSKLLFYFEKITEEELKDAKETMKASAKRKKKK